MGARQTGMPGPSYNRAIEVCISNLHARQVWARAVGYWYVLYMLICPLFERVIAVSSVNYQRNHL